MLGGRAATSIGGLSVHNDIGIDEGRVLTQSGKLEIKVIAIELSLNRVPSQAQEVLLKFLVLLIFPVLIYVLLVEVILFRRNKRSSDLSVPEVIPGEVTKPRMSFDLGRSVKAQSVGWLSLNHLPKICQKLMQMLLLTLLMKSAASTDQPLGISLRLI